MQLDLQPPCLMDHPRHRCTGVLSAAFSTNARDVCVCIDREPQTSKRQQAKSHREKKGGGKKKKNDISCNSCRRWHWEERRERPAEGGEQLTRSDTGKRGDLIAQLAKSTGRKQQERLVPLSLAQLSAAPGGSLCGLPLLPLPTPPPLFPRTAACHGSLRWNKMISPHLLVNTGHRGSHAKAGPFVLDRDH